jgi:hypothetical protein
MPNGALKLSIRPVAGSGFLVRRDIRTDQAVWKRLAIESLILDYLARPLGSQARLAQRILKIRLAVALENSARVPRRCSGLARDAREKVRREIRLRVCWTARDPERWILADFGRWKLKEGQPKQWATGVCGALG